MSIRPERASTWRFLGPLVTVVVVGVAAINYLLGGIGPALFGAFLALIGAGGTALLIRRSSN